MKINKLLADFDFRYIENRLRPTTQMGYRVNIENHIRPILGEVSVNDLNEYHLDKLVLDCREKGLNNTTIVYVLAVLRKAINWGNKKAICFNHVMMDYDNPRIKRFDTNILTGEQLRRLNHPCNHGLHVYPAILLASKYGCRRGEVLGAMDRDIDFASKSIEVGDSVVWKDGKPIASEGKNKKSRRVILLDSDDVSYFKWHRHEIPPCAGGFLLRNRERAYTQSMLNKDFKKLLFALSLPNVRFHDLRHSYATFMLKQGVNPKIVSDVLGHSSVKVTLDIYTHVDLLAQLPCIDALKGLAV